MSSVTYHMEGSFQDRTCVADFRLVFDAWQEERPVVKAQYGLEQVGAGQAQWSSSLTGTTSSSVELTLEPSGTLQLPT